MYFINGVQNISKTTLTNVYEKEKSWTKHIQSIPKEIQKCEESLRAKLREMVECEYIEHKKNLQWRDHKVDQREHKVDQKEHEFALKQKWAKR